MKTFLKANIASTGSSFCDYLVTILFVQFLFVDKVMAGIAGTVFGGIVNFIISRHWVFKTALASFSQQGKRYFITWFGNLLLNSAGLFCLINILNIQYLVAKIATSIFVAFVYNYPLQKRYVFKLSD